MNGSYFITATGTGIGKTLVTCLLLRQLIAKKIPAIALKPLITGFDPAEPGNSDTVMLLSAMGQDISEETIAKVSPWRFKNPISPHLAAAQEHSHLTSAMIAQYCRDHASGTTLIEGIGGVMTPINTKETVLDWMSDLQLPVLLVTGSYLGTFSHTLTTLEALRSRSLVPAAIIVSASDENEDSLQETAATLRQFAPKPCRILTLPRLPLDRNGLTIDNNILNNVPDLTHALT